METPGQHQVSGGIEGWRRGSNEGVRGRSEGGTPIPIRWTNQCHVLQGVSGNRGTLLMGVPSLWRRGPEDYQGEWL